MRPPCNARGGVGSAWRLCFTTDDKNLILSAVRETGGTTSVSSTRRSQRNPDCVIQKILVIIKWIKQQ